METAELLEGIRWEMPLAHTSLDLSQDSQGYGLVIVDEVNGFATVGAGSLAPQTPNEQVSRMVEETNRIAHGFASLNRPMLAFLDTHEPGKPEPPYPPHCEKGTGEEELVPQLKWLESEPMATLVRKDCINGFIGSFLSDGSNAVLEWIQSNQVKNVLVVGICTDICVMDFVLTLLSVRNHGMAPGLREVMVYEQGCSTYSLPRTVAEEIGLPSQAGHPQELTHHMGLYFMASRGAQLINRVIL